MARAAILVEVGDTIEFAICVFSVPSSSCGDNSLIKRMVFGRERVPRARGGVAHVCTTLVGGWMGYV